MSRYLPSCGSKGNQRTVHQEKVKAVTDDETLKSSTVSLFLFQVPFLDPTHTLIYPILPLTAADYEEFGYPGDINDFHAIREYSPYDNIPKDVLYPAVLVTSSFSTR